MQQKIKTIVNDNLYRKLICFDVIAGVFYHCSISNILISLSLSSNLTIKLYIRHNMSYWHFNLNINKTIYRRTIMQSQYDILKCLNYMENMLSVGHIKANYEKSLYRWYDEVGQTIMSGVKVDEKENRIIIGNNYCCRYGVYRLRQQERGSICGWHDRRNHGILYIHRLCTDVYRAGAGVF